MVFSALPLTPPISADAAVITSYEKTGYYDFTSDYVVGTTGNNAIENYTGSNFVLSAKSWDGNLDNTKDGTPRTAGTTNDTLDVVYQKNRNVVSTKADQPTEYSYSADDPTTKTITTNIDSLFFRDGLIYIPNIYSYVGDDGFRISWTEQYFSKPNGSEAGNGVFCLAYSSGGFETNLFKWSTSDNFLYQGSTQKVNLAPEDSHIYNISLTGDSNGYITVNVYDTNKSSTVINYTSTVSVTYSDLTKFAIGSGNYDLAKFGKFAISNLTIEKASTTGSLDRTKEPTTSVTGLNGDLKLRWFSESNVQSVTGTPEGTFNLSDVSGYKAATFNNSKFSFTVSSNLQDAGLSTNIDNSNSNRGMTIAFMARFGTYSDAPIFTLHNAAYTTSGKKTIFSVSSNGKVNYQNGSGSTNNQQLTNPPALNTWHTYIVKFYGSKKLEIWIDGKPQKFISDGNLSHGSDYYDNHTFDIPNVIKVGSDAGTTTYFNGSIRDFRVYKNNQNSITLHKNLLAIANETQSREEITATAYGVVSDNSNKDRITTDSYMNVVNDGQSASTNAGILKFDISSLTNGGYRVGENTKLRLKVFKTWFDSSYVTYNSDNNVTSVTSNTNNRVESYAKYYSNGADLITTDVYYSLDSANANRVGGVNDRKSTKITGFSTSNTSASTVKSNVALLGVTDTTSPLGSIPQKNMTFCDINVAEAVNDAIEKGKTEIYFILIKNKYDESTGSQPWTDTHFKLDEQQLIIDKTYTADFVNVAGQVISTVTALNSADAYSHKPASTAAKIESNGNGTHKVTNYSWSLTPTNNVFTENPKEVNVDCTYNPDNATCMSKAICSVCKAPVGNLKEHSYTKETFVDAVGNNNSYTKYTCTMCGQEDETVKARKYTDQSSYWETYRALRAQAKDKIAENAATNGTKYTSASINALENAIARVREEEVGDKTKSQLYIENENTILRVATNELKLNQYSITVKYVDENGNDLAVGEKGATSKTYPAVNYGSILNVVAPTNYNKVDYAVYKWTRNGTDGDIISGLNSSSLDVVVKGASTYYVFLKNTSVDDTKVGKNAVITLNNKSGNVVDIGYVPMNQNGTETKATVTVDTAAGTIKIGDATLTAPKYSFYNLIGFEIGGIRVASGQTITLNSKMVIRPVYKAKQTVRITRATGSNFLINEQDVPSIDVEWNKKIVASTRGGSSVIWKAGVDYDGNGTIEDSEKNVVAYGSTYTFYSNSNVTIYTETSASAPAEPTASIGFFSYDATDNKVTVVNNFYVPDGMTATKAGVILSTKNSTREALIAQTNGKFEGDESQFTTDKNQIRISVSRTANTEFTMYALAYVVVEDANGKTNTYYAPTVRSITYPVTNS